MSFRINARVDGSLFEKIVFIARKKSLSRTEVIRRSIAAYYDLVIQSAVDSGAKNLLSSFIGCADGDANLSSNYKDALKESLRQKYP